METGEGAIIEVFLCLDCFWLQKRYVAGEECVTGDIEYRWMLRLV